EICMKYILFIFFFFIVEIIHNFIKIKNRKNIFLSCFFFFKNLESLFYFLSLLCMCGIVGIISPNEKDLAQIATATNTLNKRGPDHKSTTKFKGLTLGHARLSIIDKTDRANQPFSDPSGRY